MPKFDGKTVLVTGASRGIGRSIAMEFSKSGASVVVNYNANADAAESVVSEIRKAGSRAQAIQADVSDLNDAERLIKTTIDQYGSLDILVNNAGIARDGLVVTMKEQDWDEVLNTNLKGTWNCCKVAVKAMLRKRQGRIINITSISGLMGQAGNANYSASKAGMIGLTKALAREVASRQITVNAVAPGFMDIGMSDQFPPEVAEHYSKSIPLGYWGNGEDVAYAVAFLASDEARYITGQVLSVDGGFSM